MRKKTFSEIFAAFALDLSYGDIPPQALAATKYHALDAIGVALAASGSDTADTVRKTVRRLGGKAESSVLGAPETFPAPSAALANATMVHTPDFDDTHGGSVIHPSAVIIPTALAVAESLGAGGRETLAAAVAGYEVLLRLGLASPGNFHKKGFHPTGVCGVFGAILTAAKLQKLLLKATIDALGIGGSQGSGILEFLSDGSSTKRIHPGWACYGGIVATMLASDGLTGPRTVFEGGNGFFRSHLGDGEFDLEGPAGTLGSRWETENISYKLYPCCHYLIAFVDCAKALRRDHSLRAEDIREIETVVAAGQARLVCEPAEDKFTPRTPYDAKFSLPYAVAVTLLRGECMLDDYTEKAIGDAEVLRLTRKVRHTVADTGYPRVFPGLVRIRLADGRVLEHKAPVHRGGPENPVGDDEIVKKFERNAALALPPEAVRKAKEMILSLDRLDDISALTRVLAFRPETREV